MACNQTPSSRRTGPRPARSVPAKFSIPGDCVSRVVHDVVYNATRSASVTGRARSLSALIHLIQYSSLMCDEEAALLCCALNVRKCTIYATAETLSIEAPSAKDPWLHFISPAGLDSPPPRHRWGRAFTIPILREMCALTTDGQVMAISSRDTSCSKFTAATLDRWRTSARAIGDPFLTVRHHVSGSTVACFMCPNRVALYGDASSPASQFPGVLFPHLIYMHYRPDEVELIARSFCPEDYSGEEEDEEERLWASGCPEEQEWRARPTWEEAPDRAPLVWGDDVAEAGLLDHGPAGGTTGEAVLAEERERRNVAAAATHRATIHQDQNVPWRTEDYDRMRLSLTLPDLDGMSPAAADLFRSVMAVCAESGELHYAPDQLHAEHRLPRPGASTGRAWTERESVQLAMWILSRIKYTDTCAFSRVLGHPGSN